jgi:hypothetical protein
VVKTLFDGAKVNRLFYNLEVVWDAEPVRVHWLVEDRGSIASPKLVN